MTFPRKLNNRPSDDMAYMHLGKENNEPNKVVVIPHKAPIDTRYFIQGRSLVANAWGRAALGSIDLEEESTKLFSYSSFQRQ